MSEMSDKVRLLVLEVEVERLRKANEAWQEVVAASDDRFRRIADIPEQPDGINDDSRDMPEPREAAKRVMLFVAASGDGLYDARDGHPLYGRDLEVLCRQVLG